MSSALIAAVFQVAASLSGTFTSEEQSKLDPDFYNISLKSCPALVMAPDLTQADVKYLYVEQALATNLEAPYRQRIYRISGIASETSRSETGNSENTKPQVKSEIFLLSEPQKFVGFCNKELSERVVQQNEITGRDCYVVLEKGADNLFAGQTPVGGCPSSFKGAVRAESIVKLLPNGLFAWDRGYNEAGEVVWGPTKGPYRFRRKN